jgi:predicted GIY-YIG superfamily endonuclease
MKSCVYILSGRTFYVGSTQNLKKRLSEHKQGKSKFTSTIGKFELVRVIETETIEEARNLEKKIKRSGHIERWIK